MTYYDLYHKLHDEPFKPFRLRLVNNQTFDIVDPGMIILGETSAVVPTQTVLDDRGARIATDWRTISIAHILEFADLNIKPNGGRKRAS